MEFISLSVIVIFIAYAWITAHPNEYRAVIAELKRRWRLHLIQRHGHAAAAELFHLFRQQVTAQGFDERYIDEIIDDLREDIVERLGLRETNARIGEPTPLERYF